MGHHRKGNQFQSDKKPKIDEDGFLEPDKIVLSFKDPAARLGLDEFARWTTDRELMEDVKWRLDTIRGPDGSPDKDKQILLTMTHV